MYLWSLQIIRRFYTVDYRLTQKPKEQELGCYLEKEKEI